MVWVTSVRNHSLAAIETGISVAGQPNPWKLLISTYVFQLIIIAVEFTKASRCCIGSLGL